MVSLLMTYISWVESTIILWKLSKPMLDKNNIETVNQRSGSLSYYKDVKRFDRGVFLNNYKQVTYHEKQNHMKICLGCVSDLLPLQAALCLREFVDFYIAATSNIHTDETLQETASYLTIFLTLLPIFEEFSNSRTQKNAVTMPRNMPS
ncbi:unnamed protein product [Absidia cylindrospora]